MESAPAVVVLRLLVLGACCLPCVAAAGAPARDSRMVMENPLLLPVLPLRGSVLFPGAVLPLNVGREKTIALVKDALARRADLVVLAQLDPAQEAPRGADLNQVGTRATIVQFVQNGDGWSLVLQGSQRVRVARWVGQEPWLTAEVLALEDEPSSEPSRVELEGLAPRLVTLMVELLTADPAAPPGARAMVQTTRDLGVLVMFAAANLGRLPLADQQRVLEASSMVSRVRLVISLLERARTKVPPPGAVTRPAGPQTLQSLLADAHDLTAGTLATMMKSYGQVHQDLHLELAVRAPGGALVLKDGLPRRVDLTAKAQGQLHPLTSVTAGVEHPPLALSWKPNLAVVLGDLAWDSCLVRYEGDRAKVGVAVRAWYLQWFDPNDARAPDAQGLHGVVHELDLSGSAPEFDVDFGSAPVTAFTELLDALASAGVSKAGFTRGRRAAAQGAPRTP